MPVFIPITHPNSHSNSLEARLVLFLCVARDIFPWFIFNAYSFDTPIFSLSYGILAMLYWADVSKSVPIVISIW